MNYMKTTYAPIDRDFVQVVQSFLDQKKFVRVEFLTDLNEYYKKDALLKHLTQEENGEYLTLSTGDLIRLDRLISVGGQLSPHFPGYESTYACSV